MTTHDNDSLRSLLTLYFSAGKLDASHVLPALRNLSTDLAADSNVADLAEQLHARDEVEFIRLSRHLRIARLEEARQFHKQRKPQRRAAGEIDLPRRTINCCWATYRWMQHRVGSRTIRCCSQCTQRCCSCGTFDSSIPNMRSLPKLVSISISATSIVLRVESRRPLPCVVRFRLS